tara:strand:- start:579 stop:1556 length:978 start_codon:yes stop_codon:yes gene_type:complete
MAATSSIEYCTDRDLMDVYPSISEFDLKRRIYSFVTTDTSNFYKSYNTGEITTLFFDGIEGTAVTDDPNSNYEFRYSPGNDSVELFINTANPNDMIIEAGDDWENIKTRIRRQASRLLESRIDARLAKEVSKDREGNYPEIIKRATALQAVILLLTAHDPNSEVIDSFKAEYNEILDGLNAGTIVLPTDRTEDSRNGIIREVSVNANSTVRPVELKGQYIGSGYDLFKLKVYVDGGGSGSSASIGTAKYSVWNKNDTGLKNNQVIENQIITGDYDVLSGGLYVRFSGVADNSVAFEEDEYEVEVFSANLGSSAPSGIGTITMVRR